MTCPSCGRPLRTDKRGTYCAACGTDTERQWGEMLPPGQSKGVRAGMIDDITLAVWEKNVREGAYTSVHYVGDRLQEAIAEIRRQREEHRELAKHLEDTIDPECRRLLDEALTKSGQWYEYGRARLKENADWCEKYSVLEDALAAHQAVVRELAELLDVDALPEFANEGDMVAWVERKNAALAYPIVAAARTEGRG